MYSYTFRNIKTPLIRWNNWFQIVHGVTDLAGESKHIYIALPESPKIPPLTISNFQCNFIKVLLIHLHTHYLHDITKFDQLVYQIHL